jgi:hypothetical protein
VAEAYLKAAKLFRNYNDAAQDPYFTKVIFGKTIFNSCIQRCDSLGYRIGLEHGGSMLERS